MQIELNTDELVEAIMFDDDAVDKLTERLTARMIGNIREMTREEVREAFDYHHDHFRVSWMRMMETELEELVNSDLDHACNHGQAIYRGLFHAIRQFIEAFGDEFPTATPTSIDTAVQNRISMVWQNGGYTVDTRPAAVI